MFRKWFEIVYFCVLCPSLHQLICIIGAMWLVPSAESRVDYTNHITPAPGGSLQVIFVLGVQLVSPRSGSCTEEMALGSPYSLTGMSLDAPMVVDHTLHCLWPDFVSSSQQMWTYALHSLFLAKVLLNEWTPQSTKLPHWIDSSPWSNFNPKFEYFFNVDTS